MDLNEKKDKFDQANDVFKKVYAKGISEFKFLPNWNLEKANYLDKNESYATQNKKIYPKGSIVFINFGINVGCEMSGRHFGIVLNNFDNSKNDVLTIIPLSSKEKRFYIALEETISNQGFTAIENEKNTLKEIISSSGKIELFKIIEQLKSINPNVPIEDIIKTVEKNFNSYLDKTNSEPVHLDKDELENSIRLINTYSQKMHIGKNPDLNMIQKTIIKSIKQLDIFVNKLSKYKDTSYASVSQIQTISKQRVIKFSKNDPIIQVTDPTLTLLENEIKHILFKIDK